MKQYRAYAFDMDLTLLNTLETAIITYNAAFSAAGVKFNEEEVVRHLSIPLRDSYAEIKNPKGVYNDFLNAFVETSRETFLDKSKFYDDALEVLDKLYKDGYKLGIVTNRDMLVIESVLNKAGIRHYFSSIVTVDRVTKLKPDAEPVNLCLKELGVNKDEMVFIGDAKNDWMSAVNAGVDFIAIERYDNCKYDAKVKVHSLLDILK